MIYKVMNRNHCEKYCTRDHSETSVIISIKSPWDCDAIVYSSEMNGVKDILRLAFNDLEYEKSSEYCIQKSDGEQIAEFVNKWFNKVDILIIHCDGGISRSAGVMQGILKAKLNDDSLITNNHNKKPNKTCFNVTYNALINNN